MPTGYTADVQDGKITKFRDFAMQCARAFGACITMRDDPSDAAIPDEFKPSDYHEKALASARAELDALSRISPEERQEAADGAYRIALANHEKWEDERRAGNARYRAMRAQVEAWQPPSSDHIEMKNFMLQQLDTSMDNWERERPKRQAPIEWLGERVRQLQRDIEYHTKGQREEVERAATRTLWVQQLRSSLREFP